MKLIKQEIIKFETADQNWVWFKEYEKLLIANLFKAQELVLAWRNQLRSAEFWNISWLWTAFLMKICSLRIRFAVGQGARRKLMSWVSSRVPKKYLAKGFPDCFRDGIILCALNERLAPGACPRFDLLDPDQPLRNLKLALHLVQKHAKIKPNVTAEEILEGGKFSEKRLLLLVAQMKLAFEKFKLPAASLKSKKDYMSQTTFVSEKCFARGMGLLLAVRGRKACYTILLNSTDNLDMVIEIRGPRNTACNKRITNVNCLSRSNSSEVLDIMDAQVKEDILSKIIPLTYRILGRKISVSYTPLESGTHNMSIIWQGQHILGSPYTITVDSSVETPDIWAATPKRNYSRLKRSDSQYYDNSVDYTNERSLSTCHESSGTVIRKRILRYIVKVDGDDVVIDGKEDLCKVINDIKLKRNKNLQKGDDNTVYCPIDNSNSSLYNESVAKYKSEKNCVSSLNSNSSKNFNPAVLKQESVPCKDTKNSKNMLQNDILLLENNTVLKDFKPTVIKQESALFKESNNSKCLLENDILSSENSNVSKDFKPTAARPFSEETKFSKYLQQNYISSLEDINFSKDTKPTAIKQESPFTEDTKNSKHLLENDDIKFDNSEKVNESSNFTDRINYFQRRNNETSFASNDSKTDFEKVKVEQNLKTENMAVTITKPLPETCVMFDKTNEKNKTSDELNYYKEERGNLPETFSAKNTFETNPEVSLVQENNKEYQLKCRKYSNESVSLNPNSNKNTCNPGSINDDISFFPVHKTENMAVAITKPLTDTCVMFDKTNEKNKTSDELNYYKEERGNLPETFSAKNTFETNPEVSLVQENNKEYQLKCRKYSNESVSLNPNSNKHTCNPGSINDDISFFPVHKVEYDILQDDDTDDQDEFNPKRRKSFTELNECNYLEHDSMDADPYLSGTGEKISTEANGVEENFDVEDGDINSEAETLKNQEEPTSLDSFGSSTHSSGRASSLFECDHSLAFWSETVDETTVDSLPYEESQNLSEEHVFEMWESKLKELESSACDEGFAAKLDDYADDEAQTTEYVEKNSYFSTFCGFEDLMNCEASNFQPQSAQSIFEDDQKDIRRKSSSEDLSDHKKRLSWSDRDVLPSIQESSVEGLLEFDIIQSEKLNKEMSQNKNKCISGFNTNHKLDETFSKSIIENIPALQRGENVPNKEIIVNQTSNKFCSIALPPQNYVKKHSTNNLENDSVNTTYRLPGDFRKSTKNENDIKSSYLSMNILSASPYKSRNTEISSNVSKSSVKIENSSELQPISNEQTDSSKAKDESESYILTFATPIVIDELEQLDNSSIAPEAEIEDKADNSLRAKCSKDPNEEVCVQSLSVKKVIEIFQKEKEEPIDIWPTETEHSKFQNAHKKRKEVIFSAKHEEKTELLEIENQASSLNFQKKSPTEISRSSIKDRVKLFENDKINGNVSLREVKKNTIEKCSDSKVSARKNYWENMMH